MRVTRTPRSTAGGGGGRLRYASQAAQRASPSPMTYSAPTPRIHRAQITSDRLRPQAGMDRRHEASPTNGFAARDGCGLAVSQLREVLGPEAQVVSNPVLTVADVAA